MLSWPFIGAKEDSRVSKRPICLGLLTVFSFDLILKCHILFGAHRRPQQFTHPETSWFSSSRLWLWEVCLQCSLCWRLVVCCRYIVMIKGAQQAFAHRTRSKQRSYLSFSIIQYLLLNFACLFDKPRMRRAQERKKKCPSILPINLGWETIFEMPYYVSFVLTCLEHQMGGVYCIISNAVR